MSENRNNNQPMRPPMRGPMRGPMHGPMGGPMGGGPGSKAKDFKGSLKKLVSYLSPFSAKIFTVLVLAAVSTVFTIVGPKILARATDELSRGIMSVIMGGNEGIDFGYIGNIMFMLICLYAISACFSYLQGFVMAGISTKVSYNLRNEIIKKVNRMPLDYFHRTSHGEVLSRITNDVDTLNHSLNMSLTQIITSITSIIGVLIMMLSISWQLTIIALFIVPISLGLIMTVMKMTQKYFRGQQQHLGAVNGHIEEMYGGHLVVKAFNGEKKSIETFENENDKLYDSAWKSQFLSGLMMPIMGFIGNIGYVLICIIGAWLTTGGKMTIGGIQAFIQYVRSFTQPITQLANITNQFQSAIAAAERVFEFLDEAEETVTEAAVRVNHTDIPDSSAQNKSVIIKGDIRFKNVKFGYTPDNIVIKNFSADIKAGQKIAIVGPTGAGKTTMVKLLMRFYDINDGAIFVDGHNISDFTREDLRTEFGMVLQDTWLYNGSIMDNIRYGKLDATDDEVIKAAKAAQVDHFVRTLPDSYKMELNEETSNISQGQKQLLTIARAILADSRVLILDEATSSVDTRTEILIQKAMDNLMRGRTSFIIAHRLSTIRNADLILCMRDGDIAEQGTHDELMRKNGFYANLYNSQFENMA